MSANREAAIRDAYTAIRDLETELAAAREALEDIASGDWQRYPNRERHKCATVQDFARRTLDATGGQK